VAKDSAALTDEWALNVTYRRDRGEPRMSLKKASLHDHGQPPATALTVISASMSVRPGWIFADGIQLGCIQCGLCIDACDTVMAQIGRPSGLIAYDTDINSQRRRAGKPPILSRHPGADDSLMPA